MTISTSCDECGKKYKVPDDRAGKRIKCKECGATMRIPDGDDDPYVEDDEPAPARRGSAPAPLVRRGGGSSKKPSKKPQKSEGSGAGLVIGLVVGLFLVVGLVVGGIVMALNSRVGAGGDPVVAQNDPAAAAPGAGAAGAGPMAGGAMPAGATPGATPATTDPMAAMAGGALPAGASPTPGATPAANDPMAGGAAAPAASPTPGAPAGDPMATIAAAGGAAKPVPAAPKEPVKVVVESIGSRLASNGVDLNFIPADMFGAIVLHPSRLLTSELIPEGMVDDSLAGYLDEGGIDPRHIQRVMLVFGMPNTTGRSGGAGPAGAAPMADPMAAGNPVPSTGFSAPGLSMLPGGANLESLDSGGVIVQTSQPVNLQKLVDSKGQQFVTVKTYKSHPYLLIDTKAASDAAKGITPTTSTNGVGATPATDPMAAVPAGAAPPAGAATPLAGAAPMPTGVEGGTSTVSTGNPQNPPVAVWSPNELTIVLAPEKAIHKMMDAENVDSALTQRLANMDVESDIAVVVCLEQFSGILSLLASPPPQGRPAGRQDPDEAAMQAMMAALPHLKGTSLYLDFVGTNLVRLDLDANDAAGTTVVNDAAGKLEKMIKRQLTNFKKQNKGPGGMPKEAMAMLDKFAQGFKITKKANTVSLVVATPEGFSEAAQGAVPLAMMMAGGSMGGGGLGGGAPQFGGGFGGPGAGGGVGGAGRDADKGGEFGPVFMETTAVGLYAEVGNDLEATKKKFNGKTIVITGNLADAEPEFSSGTLMGPYDAANFSEPYFSLRLRPSEKDKLAKAVFFQEVKLKANVLAQEFNLQLQDVEILEMGPDSVEMVPTTFKMTDKQFVIQAPKGASVNDGFGVAMIKGVNYDVTISAATADSMKEIKAMATGDTTLKTMHIDKPDSLLWERVNFDQKSQFVFAQQVTVGGSPLVGNTIRSFKDRATVEKMLEAVKGIKQK